MDAKFKSPITLSGGCVRFWSLCFEYLDRPLPTSWPKVRHAKRYDRQWLYMLMGRLQLAQRLHGMPG
jgi:hypothetical protein